MKQNCLVLVLLTTYSSLFAQRATILADVNPGFQEVLDVHTYLGSGLKGLLEYNNRIFFTYTTAMEGNELWVTDGTVKGTRLITDLAKSTTTFATSSAPLRAIGMNGKVYFTAAPYKLYVTDSAYTRATAVSDIDGGSSIVAYHNKIYFIRNVSSTFELYAANDQGVTSTGIWGAFGLQNKQIWHPYVFKDTLYFLAGNNSVSNMQLELWKTDGTIAGTSKVTTLTAASCYGTGGYVVPEYYTDHKGILYFGLRTSTTTSGLLCQLFRTDGTMAGTYQLNNNTISDARNDFVVWQDTLHFVMRTDAGGIEVWKTDGTVGGTRVAFETVPGAASTQPSALTVYKGALYFLANGGQLHKWDGSTATSSGVHPTMVSTIRQLFVTNGLLCANGYVSNFNGHALGYELLASDSNTASMQVITDLNADTASSNPTVVLRGAGFSLLYARLTAKGTRLLLTNGTVAGTQIADPRPSACAKSSADNLTPDGYYPIAATDKFAVFTANDPQYGNEVFVTDGTRAGTRLLKDINTTIINGINQTSYPSYFTRCGNYVFFRASAGSLANLWRTDGTTAGTVNMHVLQPAIGNFSVIPLATLGNKLFFVNRNSMDSIYVTDGTAAGTYFLKMLGEVDKTPEMVPMNGKMYMSVRDETVGRELYVSDGTPAGTVLVKDIYSGSSSSNPTGLTVLGNTLFFHAYTSTYGRELWKSDGTASGTVLVKATLPGTGDKTIYDMVTLGNYVYWVDQPSGASRLLRSDGTDAGTTVLKTANYPEYLYMIGATNNRVYFRNGVVAGSESLWATDGTIAGMQEVRDASQRSFTMNLNSTTNPIMEYPFLPVNDKLYFTAWDDIGGFELWQTDGTSQNTKRVIDINPGAYNSYPNSFYAFNSMLLFSAFNDSTGFEWWKLDPSENCTPGQVTINHPQPCAGHPLQFSASRTPNDQIVGYNWDMGNGSFPQSPQPSVTYPTAGNYTIRLQSLSEFGCRDTAIKNLTLLSAPTGANITGTKLASGGVTYTYTGQATGADSYVWVASNGSFQGPSTGTSVQVKWNPTTAQLVFRALSNNGCRDTSFVNIQVSHVGLPHETQTDILQVYPNPSADGLFNFKCPNGDCMSAESYLFNIQGQLQQFTCKAVSGNEMQLQLGDLPAGIYLLEVHDAAGHVWHSKLVKQ